MLHTIAMIVMVLAWRGEGRGEEGLKGRERRKKKKRSMKCRDKKGRCYQGM